MSRWLRAVWLVALAGCGEPADTAAPAAPEPPAIEREVTAGPVSATVALRPAEPRIGDALTLTLSVTAAPGVELTMPDFGEALGRFSITSFEPRQRTADDGATVREQIYTLQPPMSGPQRIPPLRVEFVDARPDSDDRDAVRELLTDELPVTVASVVPDGAVTAELHGPRGRLDDLSRSWLARRWWLLALAALGIAAMILGITRWRRAAAHRVKVNAYAEAMKRLAALESRGLPDAAHADAWFVELSGVVRGYVEDRFGLRAPELTTEEFLQEARRSRALTGEDQVLLASFLAICDRVEFARHAPNDAESRGALGEARQFLADTRLAEAEPSRTGEVAA